MLNSHPATQGFEGDWGLVSDTDEQWKDVLHVDQWCDAQHVQRQGTTAENELLVMSRKDSGRRIWPIAVSATKQHSVGSSNAVKSASARFPWMGSGFDLTQGMSSAYRGPSGTKASLLAAAQSRQLGSRKGLFIDGYLFDCEGCRDILYATTFGSVFCFVKGGCSRKCSKQSGGYRRSSASCKRSSNSERRRIGCSTGTSNQASQ